MPGNVAAPNPTSVMPAFLARSFELAHSFEVDTNTYPDGSYQAKALTSASRRVWRASIAFGSTALSAMRAFFAVHGNAVAFWFYYWRETTPAGTVDETCESTVGRYPCVFSGEWTEAVVLGRTVVALEIVEVA